MILDENDPRSSIGFARLMAAQPKPPAPPTQRPRRHYSPRLLEAVRRIPAGDDRAAFYEGADALRSAAMMGGAADILAAVARAEPKLSRRAADALWLHADEDTAGTITEGTRSAIARSRGERYDRSDHPTVLRRSVATLPEAPSVAASNPGPLSVVEGRAVPYNDPEPIGLFVEEIAPGAFDANTVHGSAQLALLLTAIVTPTTGRSAGSTAWTSPADGLHGTWQLSDTADARHAAQLARSGEMAYLSIGFVPLINEWTFLPDSQWNPEAGPSGMDRSPPHRGALLRRGHPRFPLQHPGICECRGHRRPQRQTCHPTPGHHGRHGRPVPGESHRMEDLRRWTQTVQPWPTVTSATPHRHGVRWPATSGTGTATSARSRAEGCTTIATSVDHVARSPSSMVAPCGMNTT